MHDVYSMYSINRERDVGFHYGPIKKLSSGHKEYKEILRNQRQYFNMVTGVNISEQKPDLYPHAPQSLTTIFHPPPPK